MATERISILALGEDCKLGDNVSLRLGDGTDPDANGEGDVQVRWDGTDLDVLVTADDTVVKVGNGAEQRAPGRPDRREGCHQLDHRRPPGPRPRRLMIPRTVLEARRAELLGDLERARTSALRLEGAITVIIDELLAPAMDSEEAPCPDSP